MPTQDTNGQANTAREDAEILRQLKNIENLAASRGLITAPNDGASLPKMEPHPLISSPPPQPAKVPPLPQKLPLSFQEMDRSSESLEVHLVPSNSDVIALATQMFALGQKKGYIDANDPTGGKNVTLLAGDPEIKRIMDRLVIVSLSADSWMNIITHQFERLNKQAS